MSVEFLDTVRYTTGDGSAPAAATAGTFGRFVATDLLGRGGMGMVLRAHDPVLDRMVALKLLAPERWAGTADSIGAQALAREGQALAKLAHPNVVTVYEMGRVGDQTFIAMELIDGSSLREWLSQRPRRWREIVRAFIECGRGLAAAHAAGLVHRDFKPENVLVGRDGRPRVTDFGLVTAGRPVAADAAVSSHGDLLVDGAVVGTPPYMAPEQWLGAAVDARTDQYAFCVALWEALAGKRPFTGTSIIELREDVLHGAPREVTGTIPRRLKPVLRRGLARDREARWPSMDELLARLTAIARPRRPWLWAGGGVLVAAGIAAAVVVPRAAVDRCAATAARIDRVWHPAARAQVERAFGQVDAATTGAQVAAALDAYAAQWAEIAGAACRTDAGAGLSATLRDQRAICLDSGANAMGNVVAVLTGADRGIVERSLDAVARLPDLGACGDLTRVGAIAAPPTDPALRRRFDELRRRMAAVDALRLRGADAALVSEIDAVVGEARALGHAPTLATALDVRGRAQSDRRDLAAAEASFREAASVAADGHDDAAVANAWISVLFVTAERGGNLDAAAALEPVADAAIRRAGEPRRLRHDFLMATGTLAARRGDFTTAEARFAEAIERAPNLEERGRAVGDRARVIFSRDGAVAALGPARQAVALHEAALGPDHPATADALYFLGQAANTAGERTEARGHLERALAIHQRADGRDSTRVASDLVELGNIVSNLGELAQARGLYEEALAIQRRIGASANDVAFTQIAIGTLLSDTAPAEALPYFDQALPTLAATVGTDDLNYLGTAMNHALALKQLGRCDEALAILADLDRGLAAYPFVYPQALIAAAQCLRGGRRPEPAIAKLEQARRTCGDQCDADTRLTIDWELGTLLAESGRDRRRGRQLVEAAVAAARGTDPPHALLGPGEAWLRAHR